MTVELPQLASSSGPAPIFGRVTYPFALERISIEVTNRCPKGCWFCYNHSNKEGDTLWTPDELIAFITDCAHNNVRAISFGGGEPLIYPGIFEVLEATRGQVFRSMTTSGIGLTEKTIARLVDAGINKVHVSIHFPENQDEVDRVITQVSALQSAGITSGVNLLVSRTNLKYAAQAASHLRDSGINNTRIVYLPMRHQDTPTPREMATVAGDTKFQSMSCLTRCANSPRFCSIGWNKQAAWCSYTVSRKLVNPLTFEGLKAALTDLELQFCGGTND